MANWRLRFHVRSSAFIVALAAIVAALWLVPAAGATPTQRAAARQGERGHGAQRIVHPDHGRGGGRADGRGGRADDHHQPPGHGGPQLSYLALGDSLAFGYSQAKFNSLFPNENPAAYDTGYVDDFGGVLRFIHPTLHIVNDGCPGETTDSFINGPCQYQLAFPLHHPYVGGPTSSQLSDALTYLHANQGTVSPITLDIGANDALGVIEGTCKMQPECVVKDAPALFAHIASNLELILTDLRGTAPSAKIIVLGLYNPFGETLPGGNQLTAQLNEVMSHAASTVDASFADPLPLFNPPGALERPAICLLTNMCTPLTDIHPTDLGYAVLAGLITRQYFF